MIYVSGQIGITPDAKVQGTIADQSKMAMDHVGSALALAGAGFDDVVKCTVMLADMKNWPALNEVYLTYFKPSRLPARSALGANGLAFGAAVEVECIAYKPVAPAR